MSSEITIQQQMDRFMQGAGDALTDDTVARLGFMINELLIIADWITRNKKWSNKIKRKSFILR